MNTALKIKHLPQPLALIQTPHGFEAHLQETTQELFELLGWNDIPQSIKALIQNDVKDFALEVLVPFTSIAPEKLERKQRIRYWMRQFKAGYCSESTVVEMLAN